MVIVGWSLVRSLLSGESKSCLGQVFLIFGARVGSGFGSFKFGYELDFKGFL